MTFLFLFPVLYGFTFSVRKHHHFALLRNLFSGKPLPVCSCCYFFEQQLSWPSSQDISFSVFPQFFDIFAGSSFPGVFRFFLDSWGRPFVFLQFLSFFCPSSIWLVCLAIFFLFWACFHCFLLTHTASGVFFCTSPHSSSKVTPCNSLRCRSFFFFILCYS